MRSWTASALLSTLVAGACFLTGPTAAAPAPVAAAATTTGLVLNYGFDNDSGVTARDTSANAINATYVNTTATAARVPGVPGRGSAAQLVSAQHQYVSVPERNALDVNRFTLAALVRYTGVQTAETLDRWEVLEKAGAYWINIRTDGHVRVGGFFGGCTNPAWQYLDSTVTVPVGTWTHVAGTYNGSTLTVWVNGVRAGSRAISGTTCKNNLPLVVGAKSNPDKGLLEAFWDGALDDVRIYRRALTAAEIRGLLPS
jgi:Concanavalin A-like lectin/glucanases superfamily